MRHASKEAAAQSFKRFSCSPPAFFSIHPGITSSDALHCILAHDLPIDQPQSFYKERSEGALKSEGDEPGLRCGLLAVRTKCPLLAGVGLVDVTSPAGAVYSAFNQARGPKEIRKPITRPATALSAKGATLGSKRSSPEKQLRSAA